MMDNWVLAVAQYRQEMAEAKEHETELNTALWATPEYARLDQHHTYMANVKANLEQAEGALRDAAMAAYKATGDKQPHFAVQVKAFAVYQYDPTRAKAWCMVHDIPGALKLDAKAFEKVADAMGLDWVEKVPEPRAQIAGDLSAYLA